MILTRKCEISVRYENNTMYKHTHTHTCIYIVLSEISTNNTSKITTLYVYNDLFIFNLEIHQLYTIYPFSTRTFDKSRISNNGNSFEIKNI